MPRKKDIKGVQQEPAEPEDPDAQFSQGSRFFFGCGVAQSYAQAAQYFLKAAQRGHAEAQRNLAIMFKNGQGVAQNDAEAVRWLRKAADQGHTIAQRNLAIMLEAGRGM
jgi:TPR repeat protein